MLENPFLNPFSISKILSPTSIEKIVPKVFSYNYSEVKDATVLHRKEFFKWILCTTSLAKWLVYFFILTSPLLGNVGNHKMLQVLPYETAL